jgi:hypothetical protein
MVPMIVYELECIARRREVMSYGGSFDALADGAATFWAVDAVMSLTARPRIGMQESHMEVDAKVSASGDVRGIRRDRGRHRRCALAKRPTLGLLSAE